MGVRTLGSRVSLTTTKHQPRLSMFTELLVLTDQRVKIKLGRVRLFGAFYFPDAVLSFCFSSSSSTSRYFEHFVEPRPWQTSESQSLRRIRGWPFLLGSSLSGTSSRWILTRWRRRSRSSMSYAWLEIISLLDQLSNQVQVSSLVLTI